MDWESTQHNGSFWFDSLGTLPKAAPPKRLPYHVDVAIIGAGYTGLWTAYYLKQHQPDLNIAVFEAVTVGFGASGRNGGWCMGLAWGIDGMLARPQQRQQGIDLLKAMHDTVDEVGRVSQAENIDCHYAKGGTLNVATVPFRVQQLKAHVAELHALGFTEDDYRWLPETEARERLNCAPNLGASYTRHCAAIHPARLVRGLGDTVRKLGVTIFEQCPVLDLEPGRVRTPHGMVKADVVLRATEGYSDTLPSQRRALLPVYSMMVATEPLPTAVWDQIGLRYRETFGDGRRLVIYGQRTLDNRFAFGGRAGYYFGSAMKPVIDPAEPLLDQVEANLRGLFPVLKGYSVTHRWGGLMGTSTTWRPSVSFDRERGIGMAGGYVGEGVAASNLAGRVLADLVTGRKTDLTRLAWVNDTARRWVPEPFRWLGVKAIRAIASKADAEEFATGEPSKLWGGLYSRLIG